MTLPTKLEVVHYALKACYIIAIIKKAQKMSKCTKRCKIVQVCSIELSEYPRGDKEKVFCSVNFERQNLTFFSLNRFEAKIMVFYNLLLRVLA